MSDNKPKRMKGSHSKTSTDNKENIKKTNINTTNNKPNTSSKKRKKSNHKKLKIFFIIVAIILIIFLGIFMYRFSKNGFSMQGFLSTLFGQNEETLANLDNLDFLLIGESGNMTDSIMACRYDPKTQKAYMLSIPRDTFIGNSEANATTSDKINCVYNIKKDPMNTVKAVNKVTGLNLKYYVFVDTKALTEIVDAIGGVEFDVPIDMEYDDTSKDNTLHINLKKGRQKIDGNKAEQLLRFRHNNDGSSYPKEYGDNDLGRMHTQRDFIKATLNQTIRANNIFKLNELLDIVNKHVKTNLSVSLIKDYIRTYRGRFLLRLSCRRKPISGLRCSWHLQGNRISARLFLCYRIGNEFRRNRFGRKTRRTYRSGSAKRKDLCSRNSLDR